MKTTIFKKPLSFFVCIVLITAMALTAIGCNDNKTSDPYYTVTVSDGAVLGEGAKEFSLEIVDGEGKSVNATVKTDKATVGEALLDLKLIAGDDGDYGLYIKCVNGITADYDVNRTYWAFYIGEAYCNYGINDQPVADGDVFRIVYTAA